MKVCIIGGMPRSGTRQFADILNRLDYVTIKGEVYTNSFKSIPGFITSANNDHDGKWTEPSYLKNRLKTILNIIAGISKGSNAPFNFNNCDISGFKCPYIEIQKNTIDFLFKEEVDKVYFFYCSRNIKDNFLSYKSNFGISVKNYVDKTIISIRSLLKMSNDTMYRVKILNLDDFIRTKNKGVFIKDNIFDFLEIEHVSEDECNLIYTDTTNRNATESVGKARLTALTNFEDDYLLHHIQLHETLDFFRNQYGISLLA